MKTYAEAIEGCVTQPDRRALVLPEVVAWAKEVSEARAAEFRWHPFGRAPANDQTVAPVSRPEPRAPLTVALADPGSSLFQDIHDPRLTISELNALSEAPDVLVLNANSGKQLKRGSMAVPDELWLQVASKGVKLVLDSSGEGPPHDPTRTEALHDFLRAKNVEPAHAAYVTQARAYPAQYGAYCDSLGVGSRRMAVWIYDRFVQRTFAPFYETGELEFEKRLVRYAAAKPARARRFICFNNLMRPIRTLFLLRLLQQGLLEDGFVSMGALTEKQKQGASRQDFINSLRSWDQNIFHDDLLPMLEELDPFVDQLLDKKADYIGLDTSRSQNKQWTARITASAIDECAESWFTIVTETDFHSKLHRITEKPFKPLLNFHPFVVLGSVGSLRLIRSYGFDTYPDFFDEGYDDEADSRTRFDMVFDQVARLCHMDQSEVARFDEAASATEVFNAWWGLVELPRLFRSRIGPALVDRLISHWKLEGSAAQTG